MQITLTFKNGNIETLNIPNAYSMKMAKIEFINTCRPDGIVIKVRKYKKY